MTRSHSRLVIAGLVLMVVGALDPMEGSVVILGGSALVAAGAYLAEDAPLPAAADGLFPRSRLAWPPCSACPPSVGSAATAAGPFGGWRSVRSYPIGWLLGLFGAASNLREREAANV